MTTTRPRRLVVAINPTASFGRGSEVGPAVVSTLRGLGHDVVALTEPDVDQLRDSAAAAVARRPDALVVVGGDGMVNLGVNVLAGTRVPLGIVPSGTGNDTARTLGIPVGDAEAAIRSLADCLERAPRVIDAAHVRWAGGERWYACMLSAGFDAIVNERANRMTWPRGASRYTIALLVELARLRSRRYRFVVDGVVVERDSVLVSVGNGVSLGGGMRVTPGALVDDGVLDLFIVHPLSRLSFARLFPKVFSGSHVDDPHVTFILGRRIRIEAEGVVVYADGERLAPPPVDIECVPGALRVLAPASAPDPRPRRAGRPGRRARGT